MTSGHVIELSASDFDEIVGKSDKPVVVDFWAPWCPPCRIMAPIFEQVAAKFAGRAVFAKLNVDEAPEIADRFSIMAIPTLIIFVNGQPVEKAIGALPADALEKLVAKYVR